MCSIQGCRRGRFLPLILRSVGPFGQLSKTCRMPRERTLWPPCFLQVLLTGSTGAVAYCRTTATAAAFSLPYWRRLLPRRQLNCHRAVLPSASPRWLQGVALLHRRKTLRHCGSFLVYRTGCICEGGVTSPSCGVWRRPGCRRLPRQQELLAAACQCSVTPARILAGHHKHLGASATRRLVGSVGWEVLAWCCVSPEVFSSCWNTAKRRGLTGWQLLVPVDLCLGPASSGFVASVAWVFLFRVLLVWRA
mmetsp:Transcript_31744/g.71188  ORF Transcript_31744/g.71188 Transcript_31744/m.71188 type:complete len:249 (+) Transcript_31744:1209-1955(+)